MEISRETWEGTKNTQNVRFLERGRYFYPVFCHQAVLLCKKDGWRWYSNWSVEFIKSGLHLASVLTGYNNKIAISLFL